MRWRAENPCLSLHDIHTKIRLGRTSRRKRKRSLTSRRAAALRIRHRNLECRSSPADKEIKGSPEGRINEHKRTLEKGGRGGKGRLALQLGGNGEGAGAGNRNRLHRAEGRGADPRDSLSGWGYGSRSEWRRKQINGVASRRQRRKRKDSKVTPSWKKEMRGPLKKKAR